VPADGVGIRLTLMALLDVVRQLCQVACGKEVVRVEARRGR
jgi:hypothetical protein